MERTVDAAKTECNKLREERNNLQCELEISRKLNKTLEQDKNKL